jgi:hypothetical protein
MNIAKTAMSRDGAADYFAPYVGGPAEYRAAESGPMSAGSPISAVAKSREFAQYLEHLVLSRFCHDG